MGPIMDKLSKKSFIWINKRSAHTHLYACDLFILEVSYGDRKIPKMAPSFCYTSNKQEIN
jgi:hypothetical protein